MEIITLFVLLMALGAGFAAGRLAGKSGLAGLRERHDAATLQLRETKEVLERETQRANESEKKLAALEADHRNLAARFGEQKQDFEKMEKQLQERFENLANKILENNSRRFTEQNREKLDQLLVPLGEKIEEFRKRVEESHKEDIRGRSALRQHLETLQNLNQSMTEEAKNLTRALKGDTKRQGNWGEVVLQRILERSGLQKGREYEIQQSFSTDEGRRLQPDVVIHLPDEKRLIIDAKVSLVAWERFAVAEEEKERAQTLKDHIGSIRAHVKGLGEKNYHQIYGIKSPDFVLMFIPMEPAFSAAMQAEPELYNEAFDRNIIIVSPTTLLATLATIDNVWKQEYQSKNAMQIAARGGALYDKFVLFIESMDEIGQRIDQTKRSYDEAVGRLHKGSGNLVRQVDMLRELGAKVSKKLPEEMIESREPEEQQTLPLQETDARGRLLPEEALGEVSGTNGGRTHGTGRPDRQGE